MRVCNEVLANQPGKDLPALRVTIDENQYNIDVNTAPALFVHYWNEAVTDQQYTITEGETQITDCLFK